jgi:hypothetical protein
MVQDSAASFLSIKIITFNIFPRPCFPNEKQFRLFPFRSPLLRKSLLLSFPPVTKMFQFAGLPLPFYEFIKEF